MNDLGTETFHIPAHVDQDWDGPQRAHDSADTQSVGNRLTKTITLRDFKIRHRAGPVAANLDHVDRVGGTLKSPGTAGRRFRGGRPPKSRGDPASHDFGRSETSPINVE